MSMIDQTSVPGSGQEQSLRLYARIRRDNEYTPC
jgi:hypothetical protein